MRNLPILLLVISVSCSTTDYLVESDYSYHGTFHKYKSFNFAENSGLPGEDEEKRVVERYMTSTLSAWGYELRERKPDLVVFYAVYYDELNLQAYEQPEFQRWLLSNFGSKEVIFKQDTLPEGGLEKAFVDTDRTHVGEEYVPITYSLKQGTLLISFFDRRKRKTVWQGYASGVFSDNQDKNRRVLRSAIVSIMDEYKLLAFDAS